MGALLDLMIAVVTAVSNRAWALLMAAMVVLAIVVVATWLL